MKTKYLPIIRDFREKINSEKNFVILHYLKNRDVNHWNLICSAMDWMSVATGYLDNPQSSKDIDVEAMLVYTYISSIDIIWEAIVKLHQAIFKTKSYPFNECRHIFKNANKTDNRHFKHIRAAFGAHPVDLKGTGYAQYASWPTNHVYTEYDWAVSLYSSDKNKKDEIFGFISKELDCFIAERIQYLSVLLIKIETEKEEFYKYNRNKQIILEGNLLKKTKKLKEEVKGRFYTSYYYYLLEDIEYLLEIESTSPKNNAKIDIFIDQLAELVNKIYKNTQDMTESSLEEERILKPKMPENLKFAYSSLCENIFGSGVKPFDRTQICDYIEKHFETDDSMAPNELYLLTIISSYLSFTYKK